jgi:hypothetical protein
LSGTREISVKQIGVVDINGRDGIVNHLSRLLAECGPIRFLSYVSAWVTTVEEQSRLPSEN